MIKKIDQVVVIKLNRINSVSKSKYFLNKFNSRKQKVDLVLEKLNYL